MAKNNYQEVDLESVLARLNAALGYPDIALICEAIGDAVMLHRHREEGRIGTIKSLSRFRRQTTQPKFLNGS